MVLRKDICLFIVALCILTRSTCGAFVKVAKVASTGECESDTCLMRPGGEKSVAASSLYPEWGDKIATVSEMESIYGLRTRAVGHSSVDGNHWLKNVTDVELLRFLRARHGNTEEAWKMITAHVEWRNSKYGADSAFTKSYFIDSPLHHEVFWMGNNKDNCPTLVVRTQIHDGIYYNEDPNVFTR